jgi:ferredoxin-type protein NapG
MSDDDKPMNRRRFFREGLAELLKPLAHAIEPIERAAHQLGALEDAAPAVAKRSVGLSVWLRPPGAIAEQDFRDMCSRCGECVKVCPAQCIKIDPTGVKGVGAPYIQVDAMPCVVCSGLECMHHCPSGALIPTALAEIDMGTAVWREDLCVRNRSEECTICIDQCPLGSAAIVLEGNRVRVIEEGCIGCGVCEHYCPTQPKSIVITPKAARD